MQGRAKYEPNAGKPHSPCVKRLCWIFIFLFFLVIPSEYLACIIRKKTDTEHFEMFHFSKCLMSFYDLQGVCNTQEGLYEQRMTTNI
jgi:hypothetical protein